MKQIIKKLLVVAILLSATLSTWAYDFEVDGIYYGKNSDGTTVLVTYKDSNYNSYSGSVEIPSEVSYEGTTYSVTSIGSSAFRGCSGLTSVLIPESVTEIGIAAFQDCTGLTSVTIPNSVSSIGYDAFISCKGLKSVNISNSVTTIEQGTFAYCSGLETVDIPDSVTSIGKEAFTGCSGMTSVTIGSSVASIGWRAFYNCRGLKSVTFPNSVTSIGDEAFRYCDGLTKVEISDIAAWCNISFGDNPLKYAHHIYLNGTEVTNLVIPNSVTSIGGSAFSGCSGLTSVTIPNSVTSIGGSAFSGCSGLTSVTIPNSVTSIVDYAFQGCSGLTSVTIPNSVTSIGDWAFYDCRGLTSVTIPNSVTSIGDWAFYDCRGLTSVTIPNSVTSVGKFAFLNCRGLTSLTIPNSVTSIGNEAFDGCSGLILVRLDATIDNVPNSVVFGSHNYLTFIIGESVKSIPKSIVKNGYGSVSKVIALADTPPTVTSETFDSSVTTSATLYVKKNTVSKYFIAEGWGNFETIKPINNSVTDITLDRTSMNLAVGESSQLKVNVQPADASLSEVVWTANNSCVSVDQNGNVKGLSEGQCVVTAEAIDGSGVKAECVVTVGNIYAQSISISQEEVALDVNGMAKLSYTILPNNTTLKDVEWSCSAESVATFKVNSDNTITVLGLRPGVATITARTTDGSNLSAICKITVTGDDVDYFTANEFDIYPGASYPFPVEMINQDEIAGFQCDIYLPEGLSIAKVDDTYDIALSDRKDDHVLSSALQSDGAVRVLSYSMTAKGYAGNFGDLFTINLTASSDYDGLGAIRMSNIIVSVINGGEYQCSDVEVNVGLKQYTLGDVNGDGSISVTDVISTANYILGVPSAEFVLEAADLNGDGRIGVGDIISIVNRILSETEATPSVTTLAVDSLEADDIDIDAGETKTVSLNLNNAEVYTGLQFDVKMPNGLKFENVCLPKLANSHKVAFKQREDGSVRVVVFSLTNEDIKQNLGSLLSFDVTADNSFVGGEIEISNVLFANKETREFTLSNLPIDASRNGGVNDVVKHSKVYVENNRIVVTAPESQLVTVSSVAGISTTYEATAGKNILPISQSGLYIVKANDLVKKVTIK